MKNVKKILKCKCPHCGKGNIFASKGNIFLLKMPKMNQKCPSCDYGFQRETGFYFGAMYVSYGIVILEAGLFFLAAWLLLNMSLISVFWWITLLIVVTSPFNFRISRSIWLYIFHEEKGFF